MQKWQKASVRPQNMDKHFEAENGGEANKKFIEMWEIPWAMECRRNIFQLLHTRIAAFYAESTMEALKLFLMILFALDGWR